MRMLGGVNNSNGKREKEEREEEMLVYQGGR